MNRRNSLLSFGTLFVCSMQAMGADASGELLARIRQRMADNLERLPNYTCLETIERTARVAGAKHFAAIDRLRLEVAYVGGRELYSWPGAGKFEEKSIMEIVGPGATIANGNFAMHARAVFGSNAPEFSWGGAGERNGRKTVTFGFQVVKEKSRYAIKTGPLPVIVAYRGLIEADAETFVLLRLEVRADELPVELELRSAGESIQYRQMRIGDSEFLLPASSELVTVTMAGDERRNLTRFEECRQYAGTSTLHFDPVESDAGVAQPAAAIVLPAGLMLESKLRDAIDGAKAAIGDVVSATVLTDVKRSGAVIVPKGAVITGRITRVERRTTSSAVFLVVGLVFHTIEFGGRRGDFSGQLEAVGPGPNYSIGRNRRPYEDTVYVKGPAERLPAGARLELWTK